MSTQHRILLVDDEMGLSKALQRTFEQRGFQVELAHSIQTARESLNAGAFSVCILDAALPDGSGVDLLEEIRANEKTKELPVIIYSGFTGIIHEKAMKLNPHAVLQKPLSIDDLLWQVKDALGLKKN